ncbi:nucleotidyltransferase [uncultured Roseobacter sp.]|uniref:nucleotidyltransferase domain-containing protein n=1 Tax=uncultured Roseobacter sp. TaxID=114847 RepID=UPI00260C55AB|nr:nucleotidyltransferase [uncultured Roseobacter sp.]
MNQVLRQPLTDSDILRRSQVFSILDEIGEALDLTESQFEKARQSYGAVGDWISGSDDQLLASAHVYLQGSSALGTAVKPIRRREFDVDVICFCAGVASGVSPAVLKAAVGNRLKEHRTYARVLEEKKRCWRLDYEGDFHLDLSPTISNRFCANNGELVPDRSLQEWHPTNPRAYKVLFDERAALKPTLVRTRVAMQRDEATVEPFPVRETVKGILRRTVQLLKRHRDTFYENSTEEIAPISVIITTLAMRAYAYCVRRHVFEDELDVLVETIRMMPHFIERPILDGQRAYAVWNETTNGENFADNWNKDERRAPTFYTWHRKALSDFESLRDAVGQDRLSLNMERSFGSRVTNQVFDTRRGVISTGRKTGALAVAPLIGLTTEKATASTSVPQNTFFGDQ